MATDPTVAGCLAKVQRGDVSAVGVLADYLDEHKLPYAKTVRAYWEKYVRVCEWTATADFSRRKNTKWENIALWRQWLRRRIAVLYKRKWKKMKVEAFK